jgi:2',3'-cyclic-nucleotide 2'-phosphodiesterase (5'-nucleotidase family)
MFVLLTRKVLPVCLVIVTYVLCQPVCGRVLKPGERDWVHISIVHINDFHARFEQVSPSAEPCLEGEEETCVGGIARVATMVKSLMNVLPNPIFLNAGDNFQGTLWYTKFKWNVTAQFMNMLPHDALVIILLLLISYCQS